MRKKSLILVSVIIGLLFETALLADQKSTDLSDGEGKEVEVFAETVKSSEMYDPLVFGAWVESQKSWVMSAPISGTLKSLRARLGETIRSGQILGTITPREVGFGVSSIRSPIDGVVTTQAISVGDQVTSGSEILRIESLSKLEIPFQVSAADGITVGKEQNLFAMWGEASIPIKVQSISPRIDPKSGLMSAIAVPDCPKAGCAGLPLIGQWLRIELRKGNRTGVKIPIKHLQSNMSEVLVKDKDGLARWRKVKLGSFFGKEVEVLEGVAAGETLVTSYAKRPKEGQLLSVKKQDVLSKKNKSIKSSDKG